MGSGNRYERTYARKAWRLKIAMLTATQKLLAGERAEEVAAYLGYAAPSAFSSAFRRVFGTSPSTFRNAELSLRKNSPPQTPNNA